MSLTYFEGEDIAIIVHGSGHPLSPEEPSFKDIDSVMKNLIGMGIVEVTKVYGGDEGLWFRIDPRVMFSFARYPDRFPE